MNAPDRPVMTLRMPVAIRLAEAADIPKLEWFGQYTHFRSVFRRTFREQQLGNRLMLVADFNHFPIGQIFVQLNSDERRLADGGRRGYLYALRVLEMFQGLGIGTRLLAHGEQQLRQRGYLIATLSVSKQNQRALRLYRRTGYRIVAEDDGDWHFVDHQGVSRQVHEPCWVLEKRIAMR